MSGIPVHTNAPINARSGAPAQTTASTTSQPNPTSTSTYSAARPGAAVPGPTAAAQHHAPLEPTRTIKDGSEGPPAPQPGPVPTPRAGLSGGIPPPPKASSAYHPAQSAAPASTMPQIYSPPQMSIPPPTMTGPPSSSTTTSTTASFPYPVAVPQKPGEGDVPRQSLEHPPGYQQNAYASELTSDQRRALEASQNDNTSGLLGGGPTDTGTGSEGFWNNTKKWVGSAGEKISAGEREIWRRINKE